MIFKPKSRDELCNAIHLYTNDKTNGISIYGDINTWDVSEIEDMSNLFSNKDNFNEDISLWNTCNVKDMSAMFSNATKFNFLFLNHLI